MKIDSAALILYDVVASMPADAPGELNFNGDIFHHRPNSEVFGVWSSYVVDAPTIQLLGKNVPFAHVRVLSEIHGYSRRICVIPLPLGSTDNDALPYLPSAKEVENARTVLMPRSPDDLVGRSYWNGNLLPHAGCIFLLRPDCAPSLAQLRDETIAALLIDLKVSGSAAMPSACLDLVMIPIQWGGYSPNKHCAALWLSKQRLFDERNEVHLPDTAMDIINHTAATMVFVHLAKRLHALPLASQTASSYLTSAGVRTNAVLEHYLSLYIADREKSIEELLETSRAADAYSAAASSNYISLCTRDKSWVDFPSLSKDHPLAYPMIKSFSEELETAQHRYATIKQLIEMREAAVKEFLRDVLSAQVAAANLNIQHRIKQLTLCAVLIGILASLVSFLPDGIKDNTFQLLISWVHGAY